MSPRVNGPLKPEALSTDLSNPFGHSFSPSAFIGRLLYTSPALGPGEMAANEPSPHPAVAQYFRGRNCRGRKGLSPPSYPYPHFVCGSLHHRRCLTYLPPLPDPVHLGTGWPSDGGGSSFPGVSERGCDPCRVRILSGTSSWSTPFLPPAEPLRKGANEPRLLLPEELGRVILVVQARLEPPQELASVPRAPEHPGGSWTSLPARPAQRQPA